MRGLSLKEGEERSYLCLISVRLSVHRIGGREGGGGNGHRMRANICFASARPSSPPLSSPSVQPHRTPFGGCAKL